VSDFIPADVVENRTDFGIFERAPQPWDQLRRVSGNLLGKELLGKRFRRC
jgi:hypothetical protein